MCRMWTNEDGHGMGLNGGKCVWISINRLIIFKSMGNKRVN